MSFLRTLFDMTRAKTQSPARRPGANAALVLTDTDRVIILNSTTGTKVATFNWTERTSAYGGALIHVGFEVCSGGSYTIACTYQGAAGTLTLDAVTEWAILQRIGSTLYCVNLNGATFA